MRAKKSRASSMLLLVRLDFVEEKLCKRSEVVEQGYKVMEMHRATRRSRVQVRHP